MGLPKITEEEISKHNTDKDCWIIIDNLVYDVSKFLNLHPGGKKIILNVAGQNASEEFHAYHRQDLLKRYENLLVGKLSYAGDKEEEAKENDFLSKITYAEPSWLQGFVSPYYNKSHKAFRFALREIVNRDFIPFCSEWDESQALPPDLLSKYADWIPGLSGCWPEEFLPGQKILGGVKPSEWDSFHELILYEELCRTGSGSFLWGFTSGLCIAVPPLLHYASKSLQQRYLNELLTGRKYISLTITEPSTGSDVANIQCTAKKTPDGKFYIVNGQKKWITGGERADYFTVACRTSEKGLSLLLIERSMGVKSRKMKCTGVWASGTSYILFEDVKVPVENLIGQEDKGFLPIMSNFNHERLCIIAQQNSFARVCYEESYKYALTRKTFGKKLIDSPVIRAKLGNMIRQIESTQYLMENILYQKDRMSKEEAMTKLGGTVALLKVQSSQTFEFCVKEAIQVFGGLAYTRGAKAEKVERLFRDLNAFAIGGGTPDIMADFGIRQAMKLAKL